MFGVAAVGLLLAGPVRTDADGVPLPAEAVCRVGSARWRAAGSIGSLVCTPDGRRVIGLDSVGLIGWEADTGRPAYRVRVSVPFERTALGRGLDPRTVLVLEPDPPAVRLETTTGGGVFQVSRFDPHTGRPLGPPQRLRENVRGLAFLGPSGRVLYEQFIDVVRRYGIDETDHVLTAVRIGAAGPPIELLRRKEPFRVAVSRDDRLVAAQDAEASPLRLLDAATGKPVRVLEADGGRVGPFAFDAAGSVVARIVTGKRQAYARWEPATGRRRDVPLDSRAKVYQHEAAIRFSPCGRFVTTLGREPEFGVLEAVVRRTDTGSPVYTHRTAGAEDDYIRAVSPDGRLVYTMPESSDRIQVRSTGPGPPAGHAPVLTPLGFDAGRLVVLEEHPFPVGCYRSVWDTRTGRRLSRTALPDEFKLGVRGPRSPDGRVVVQLGEAGTEVELVEQITQRVRHTFVGHAGIVRQFVFSPDCRYFASVSPDAPVFVWDVRGELSKPAAVTPGELDAAVRELASADAVAAFRAVRLLAHVPTLALPKLQAALPPVPPLPAGKVAGLVRDLDAPRFADRQAAGRELAALGRAAEPELRAATGSPSAEVRRRADELLARLKDGKPTADELRAVRAVEAVEWMGTDESHRLLAAWAAGGSHARLTAEATAAAGRSK